MHLTLLLLIGKPGITLSSIIVTTSDLTAAYRRWLLFLFATDGRGLAAVKSGAHGRDEAATNVTLHLQGALGGRAHLTMVREPPVLSVTIMDLG